MTADTLRRAAARMRELAEAASQPWRTRWQALHGQSWAGENVVADADGHLRLIAGEGCDASADADHCAAWDPAVALDVADWLDEVAEDWRTEVRPQSTEDAALTVARRFLRTEEATNVSS